MNKIRELRYKFWLRYMLSRPRLPEMKALRGRKKCIVCLAADYGNLGDVAITYAQSKFLAENLNGYEIVDFPISRTLTHLKALKNVCSKDDIITIVGGGNMGDMYFDIELLRLLVVSAFPGNRIISFPQTVDYSNSKESDYLIKLSQKVYSRHKDLLLCAREATSYATMRQFYPLCDVVLTPDIVMSLDEREPQGTRKGITLCLRDDKEQGELADAISALKDKLCGSGVQISEYDTHIHRQNLSIAERNKELSAIWQNFRSSEWVITDRLHGMIFAYITGTPAIVFPNSNFKIEKSFEWIKNCGYVHFVKDTSADLSALLNTHPDTSGFSATRKLIINSLKNITLR